MAIWTRHDNWLKGIADANSTNHAITDLGPLTAEDVQAAFDKTYGPNRFKVNPHGTCIAVFDYSAFVDKLQGSRSKAEQRGAAETVKSIDEMIAKYEGILKGE